MCPYELEFELRRFEKFEVQQNKERLNFEIRFDRHFDHDFPVNYKVRSRNGIIAHKRTCFPCLSLAPSIEST